MSLPSGRSLRSGRSLPSGSPAPRNFDLDRLRAQHRLMWRIRALEQAALRGLAEKVVLGAIHPSIGQEAVAAGVVGTLRRDDILLSTHRGHGHTLAKGADSEAMLRELLGRVGGTCGGKGGSMHIADFSVGMLGANGVVGANIVIAAGAAHAIKLKREDRVVCCIFGDGAINRGPFLEALNWAVVYGLPVLFVCEDNRISATTPSGLMTGGDGASARAESIGVVAERVDGNDVEAVSSLARGMIADVRAGRGPRLLHAITYRHKGHVSIDAGAYRDPEEVREALEQDPIKRTRRRLDALGHAAGAERIEREARAEIDAALKAADAAPFPVAADAYEDIITTGQGVWS